jgi:biotin transport system substrate-specific component
LFSYKDQLKDYAMVSTTQLRMTVYSSLMAALTAAAAQVSIPIGPVPIVLQNMFVLLTGLLLGSRWGLASVAVYLLAGVCGLPVFALGSGGIGRIFGPTGGYLLGYLPVVFVVGWLVQKFGRRIVTDIIAMICGSILLYSCGVTWLKILTGLSWTESLAVGVVPFLLGDALKIAAAAAIARALRPVLQLPLLDRAGHNPASCRAKKHRAAG